MVHQISQGEPESPSQSQCLRVNSHQAKAGAKAKKIKEQAKKKSMDKRQTLKNTALV